MRKHLWRSALLCGTLLAAASLAAPAFAQLQDCISDGAPCAILRDHANTPIQTFIEITNVGTAPKIVCHGRQDENELGGICDEAFSVCVKDRTNEPEIAVLGTTSFGLLPSTDSCRPFVQLLVKTNQGTGMRTVFLNQTDTFNGTPVYDLDLQLLDLDGNPNTPLQPLPKGSQVTVVMENRPNPECGRCIGVRTTIMHIFGTCKIWKTRKFFNVCKTAKTITAIREFELPCACGEASALPGAGGSRTATFSVFSTGEFITLQAASSSGVPKTKAGSIASDSDDFGTEFFGCPPKSLINPLPDRHCFEDDVLNLLYLAVLLDYKPGGMTLKMNQEAFVSFHIDFE
jgi:hypothetical protein